MSHSNAAADSEILLVPDAARWLDLSEEGVRTALRRRQLPGVRVGKKWVIPKAMFIAHLSKLAAEHMRGDGDIADAAARIVAGLPPTRRRNDAQGAAS